MTYATYATYAVTISYNNIDILLRYMVLYAGYTL